MINFIGRIFKIFLLVVVFIIVLNLLHNFYLQYSVNEVVKNEFNRIQLPGELVKDHEIKKYPCTYDYKMSRKRCHIYYTKYFITTKDSIEEFRIVDTYIRNLGWPNTVEITADGLNRLKSGGYSLSNVYYGRMKYGLRLSLVFYGAKEKEYSFTNKKVIDLMNQYSISNQMLYSISISSDIID